MKRSFVILAALATLAGSTSGHAASQTQMLHADTPIEIEGFGTASALGDGFMVVGAPCTFVEDVWGGRPCNRAVYIFLPDGDGAWRQHQRIPAPDGSEESMFGSELAIDGTTVVVGARLWEPGVHSGAAFVYDRGPDGYWHLTTRLTPPGVTRSLGAAVAIQDDIILIGAPRTGIDESGVVHAFGRTAGTWMHVQTIENPAVGGWFGNDLDLDGDRAILAAPHARPHTSGLAYVYRTVGGVWVLEQTLESPDGGANMLFGEAVSISGGRIAVSAARDGDDDGIDQQGIYFFDLVGTAWTPSGKIPGDGVASHNAGAVILDGDRLLAGCPSPEGRAGCVYQRADTGQWFRSSTLRGSPAESGDSMGWGLAFRGSTAVVGASQRTVAGVDEAGVAFVFDIDASPDPDSDLDGIPDHIDPDDDNDGVPDGEDAFPFDAAESKDTDRDTIGDNADPDDDNDGVADGEDRFPLDPTESKDADGDGTGDNADPDDDNDGVADEKDVDRLRARVAEVPDEGFSSRGHRTSLNSIINEIERLIASGAEDEAARKLESLRRRVDGCGLLPDANDWLSCTHQHDVRALIDELIAGLAAS